MIAGRFNWRRLDVRSEVSRRAARVRVGFKKRHVLVRGDTGVVDARTVDFQDFAITMGTSLDDVLGCAC